jgi:hypothetical protein
MIPAKYLATVGVELVSYTPRLIWFQMQSTIPETANKLDYEKRRSTQKIPSSSKTDNRLIRLFFPNNACDWTLIFSR